MTLGQRPPQRWTGLLPGYRRLIWLLLHFIPFTSLDTELLSFYMELSGEYEKKFYSPEGFNKSIYSRISNYDLSRKFKIYI